MLIEKIAERCQAVSTNPEDYKYRYYASVKAYTEYEGKGEQEILQVIYSDAEYDERTLDRIMHGLWTDKPEYVFIEWIILTEEAIKILKCADTISKIGTDDFPTNITLRKAYDAEIPEDDHTDYREDDESYEKSDDKDYPYTYTAIVDLLDTNTAKTSHLLVYVKVDRKLKLPDKVSRFIDEETVEGIVEELTVSPRKVATDVIVITDDNRDEYEDDIKDLIKAGRSRTVRSRMVKPFDDEETSITDA